MNDSKETLETKKLEFALFCIESVAAELNLSGSAVYLALTEQSDILKQYIIPSYEALHTQGKDYIVADILGVIKERGVKL